MRSAVTVTALVLLFFASTSARCANIVPDWELVASTGDTVRLSEEVQRQTTVLFFWATWCPYCKALMPHLQSIRLEYGEDVRILAINFRDDGDPVAFIEDAGYDFTVLPDGDAVAAANGVHGTPGVIIVDRDLNTRFDLRALQRQAPLTDEKTAGHKRKAAYRAPYWAAEIRKAIDAALQDANQ